MNLKAILLTGLTLGIAIPAFSVPARQGVRTYTQSDGTSISVMLIGDEHFHTFVTTDGLTVERDSSGDFYYLSPAGRTSVLAHNPELRGEKETDYLESAKASLSVENLFDSRAEKIAHRRAPEIETRANVSQVPHEGSPRVPIILVEYKDKKFTDADPLTTFKDFFNTGEKSAYRYFYDQSNGKFTPQFDVYGPYTLSENRAYYGGNDMYGEDKGVGKMVAEGVLGLDNQIDYSLYDNDKDGECDVMIVLYAGDGEASSYANDAENAIWPCQWTLTGSDYRKALTLDDTKINKFAVFNEVNGSNLRKIDGIGTFCHEFSHCLGLPDFYDTTYGPRFGMGPWSLLDAGSYNDDCYTPVGYSAYEKEFMGWIRIEEGRPDTYYTLPIFNKGSEETDKAVRLSNPNDPDEYFIIENRRRQGWDKYMAAEGLFIYHVAYNSYAWQNNTVNNSLQRMTPVPSDNSLKMNSYNYGGTMVYEINTGDLRGDLWPYGGNNSFTDSSLPAQEMYTGGLLGKPVTEMKINSDGTASFWLQKGDPSGVNEIEVVSDSETEYFTLQGVRIDCPAESGIYLMKRGAKTVKIVK